MKKTFPDGTALEGDPEEDPLLRDRVVPKARRGAEASVRFNPTSRTRQGFVNHYQDLVQQFHIALDLPVGNYTDPKISRPALRSDLILEEGLETVTGIHARDMVETADGLCDVVYVAFGAAVEFGIELCQSCEPFRIYPGPPIFRDALGMVMALRGASELAIKAIGAGDVHFAGKALSLLVTTCYDIAAMFSVDFEPLFLEVHRSNLSKVIGGIKRREDGKVLKGDFFSPPRIRELLEAQGWVG